MLLPLQQAGEEKGHVNCYAKRRAADWQFQRIPRPAQARVRVRVVSGFGGSGSRGRCASASSTARSHSPGCIPK
jgi:hypothetical protein